VLTSRLDVGTFGQSPRVLGVCASTIVRRHLFCLSILSQKSRITAIYCNNWKRPGRSLQCNLRLYGMFLSVQIFLSGPPMLWSFLLTLRNRHFCFPSLPCLQSFFLGGSPGTEAYSDPSNSTPPVYDKESILAVDII